MGDLSLSKSDNDARHAAMRCFNLACDLSTLAAKAVTRRLFC